MALIDNVVGVWCEAAAPVTDESVNGEHLTDGGIPGTATGKVGTAGSFSSGSGVGLTHTDDALLSSGDIDFAIGVWVKPTTTLLTLGYAAIVMKADSGGTADYGVYYHGSSGLYRFAFRGSANSEVAASSFGTVVANVWSYIFAWHDATANTINIRVNNGTINSAADSGGFDGTGNFGIGKFGSYGGDVQALWDGLINQAAVWKRIPTSTEQTQLYNSGAGLAFASWTSGGGSPVSVTVPVATLATTKFIPVIRLNKLATPPVKALTTASFVPLVLTPRRATPPVLSLTATKFAPTLLLGKIATPPVKALLTAKFIPTIFLNKIATPPTKILATGLLAPLVLTPRRVTPPVTSLVTTKFIPTAGLFRIVTPPTKVMTTTSLAPTIITPRRVTPPTIALTTTRFAPSLVSAVLVIPPRALMTLVSHGPAVLLTKLASPPTAVLALTRLAPTVITPRRVTPATKSLVLTGFAPFLRTGLAVGGLVFLEAGDIFVPGAEQGDIFVQGTEVGEVFIPGVEQGEILPVSS